MDDRTKIWQAIWKRVDRTYRVQCPVDEILDELGFPPGRAQDIQNAIQDKEVPRLYATTIRNGFELFLHFDKNRLQNFMQKYQLEPEPWIIYGTPTYPPPSGS